MRLGTHAGTFHAAEQLKKRYGLTLPLERFLDEIYEGRGAEVESIVPHRRIFDVSIPEYTESHIRVCVGVKQDEPNEIFIITFLPPKFGRELIFDKEQEHRKSQPEFLEAKGGRNRNEFKAFRRANGDADENEMEWRGATMNFEHFACPSTQGEEKRGNILGENRAKGWKEIPADAPQWVKDRITEIRTAQLAGKEYAADRMSAEDRAEFEEWKGDAIRELGLLSFGREV